MIINWKDKEGNTLLDLAAARRNHQVSLIDATVHVVPNLSPLQTLVKLLVATCHIPDPFYGFLK